jgi:hypothetical protein
MEKLRHVGMAVLNQNYVYDDNSRLTLLNLADITSELVVCLRLVESL